LSLSYLLILSLVEITPARPTDAAIVLALAAFLDYGIGDPWNWLHPVQVMGWGIDRYSQFCFKRFQHPVLLRMAGIVLTITTIGVSGLIGWGLIHTARLVHPGLGLLTEVILLASCFAGRSLHQAANAVLQPLMAGDLSAARSHLSLYVGRDTEDLSQAEILRAVLETITENATDGVMAPLFYAIVGAGLSIGSAPLALAYKAASTLDSMVGYRAPPYPQFGWCSARLEDGLTWLPCRLHVLTLAVITKQPRRVWQLCQRDAVKDPSPNSGWSECAYAAVLGVQVGGVNRYKGIIKHKPYLGEPIYPISPEKIEQAKRLTRRCFLLWLTIATVGLTTIQLT
jgi:adenosylcobinamide-phosphate synthase